MFYFALGFVFSCNLSLKIVALRDYAESFSTLHRQLHSPANDLNIMMCQTRKTERQISFRILDVGDNSPSLPNKHSV